MKCILRRTAFEVDFKGGGGLLYKLRRCQERPLRRTGVWVQIGVRVTTVQRSRTTCRSRAAVGCCCCCCCGFPSTANNVLVFCVSPVRINANSTHLCLWRLAVRLQRFIIGVFSCLARPTGWCRSDRGSLSAAISPCVAPAPELLKKPNPPTLSSFFPYESFGDITIFYGTSALLLSCVLAAPTAVCVRSVFRGFFCRLQFPPG